MSRREAPDIDIDFCKDRRGEVIQYVKEKYGEANVAQIGTFGTLAARAAIRDVGRALGMPIPRVDAIVAMVPDELGITLDEALEQSDDLKKAYDSDAEVRELLDLAMKIEGLARNVGTHAAAVVIADRPLDRIRAAAAACRAKTEVITQWAMGDVEAAGLLKMDFLGLRNLTILSKAVELIEQTTGQRVDPYKFPLDDPETFALLCRGETKGIFQLESGGIRDLLQQMKPDHFRDIIATNALYRPGPLEGGMVDDYVAGEARPQAGRVPAPGDEGRAGRDARRDGLPGAGDADPEPPGRHRAVRRLHLHQGDQQEEAGDDRQVSARSSSTGADGQGPEPRARPTSCSSMIEKFAGYGFNKSHSTAYALIAYMTAYLKAHYPVEFMAALLSGDIPGPQLQEEGFAGRAPGRLPADGHRGRAARREPLATSISPWPTGKILVRPVRPSKAAAAGGRGDRRPHGRRGGPVPQTCSISANGSIRRSRQPRGDRNARSRPARSIRSAPGARRLMAVDRPGPASRRRGAGRSPQRPEGPVRRRPTTSRRRPPARRPARPARVGRPRAAGRARRKCSASTSRAIRWPSTKRRSAPTARTPRPTPPHCRTAPKSCSAACWPRSSSRTPRTRGPAARNTKYAMFDLEDTDGIMRCILWPEEFANFGQLVAGRRDRWPCAARSIAGPAAKRRT